MIKYTIWGMGHAAGVLVYEESKDGSLPVGDVATTAGDVEPQSAGTPIRMSR